ncbi:MAG TPA: hypothetical protein VHY31_13925 [Streptosporangiaceae bacterium]|nr:hypothetical protein [Streptosporangiaceae bacterium]
MMVPRNWSKPSHNLAVIRSFYDFHIGLGEGPLRNQVPARAD